MSGLVYVLLLQAHRARAGPWGDNGLHAPVEYARHVTCVISCYVCRYP
jgi:hypothetical protein